MGAVVTLLSESVRGSLTSPQFPIAAGSTTHVQIKMISSVFPSDPTLTWDISIIRSIDGGATFNPWYGTSGVGGLGGLPVGKGGAISDGLAQITFQLDGIAAIIQAIITVNTPFSWGATGQVLGS